LLLRLLYGDPPRLHRNIKTRGTASTRPPTSTRHLTRCPISCVKAKCGRSAPRPGPLRPPFLGRPNSQNCRPTRCICLTGVPSHTHPEVHTVALLDVDGKPLRLLLNPNAARQTRKALSSKAVGAPNTAMMPSHAPYRAFVSNSGHSFERHMVSCSSFVSLRAAYWDCLKRVESLFRPCEDVLRVRRARYRQHCFTPIRQVSKRLTTNVFHERPPRPEPDPR
jgi:hypothetical protein